MTDEIGPIFDSRNAPKSQARIGEEIVENIAGLSVEEKQRIAAALPDILAPPEPEPEPIHGNRHIPTEGTKTVVSYLAAFGTSHNDIAEVMGIKKPTLYKYYDAELRTARTKVNLKVIKAWAKLIDDCDSLTVNRYMEKNFKVGDEGGIAMPLPSVLVIDNIPKDQPEISAPATPPVIDVES